MLKSFDMMSGDGATVHVSYGLYQKLEGDEWILCIDRPEECASIVLTPTELMHFGDLLFKMGALQLSE